MRSRRRAERDPIWMESANAWTPPSMAGGEWAASVATICPEAKPLSQPVAIGGSPGPQDRARIAGGNPTRRSPGWGTENSSACRMVGVAPPPAAGRGARAHPKNKMGADVAIGPHLSRVRTAAPVRAWRLSRAVLNSIGASSLGVRGSGRGLATPVGSLRAVFRRTWHLPVLRFLRPKPPVPLVLRRKWDRLAPHTSSSKFLPSLRWLSIRRSLPASAVVAFPNFLPLREVRPSSRSLILTRTSESHQAESGPSCL